MALPRPLFLGRTLRRDRKIARVLARREIHRLKPSTKDDVIQGAAFSPRNPEIRLRGQEIMAELGMPDPNPFPHIKLFGRRRA
jgi:hypothetical protein